MSRDWLDKDFYATLGVSKDASTQDIKKAYKKLARENHPDLNPGDTEAEKRFKEISEASSVLGDEKKRQEYDQIRAMGASGFYFNLSSGAEVDSSSTWHVSFQMIPVEFGDATYKMPSLILGETTYTAEYTNILFEDLEDTPDSFMSDYFQDASVVQYSGPHQVLQYDMQSHTVSVKDPERVFVVYELGNHKTYKIQFNEYVSGVIVFQYGSL